MSSPRFSIVIPSREGASTLKYTLQTCLRQDFDDYEIVVCDNCSSPATRQVVVECASPRIKYVRSETPLAMSSNWELAVSRATGQYLTVLGDDDALLPHALGVLDHMLRRTGTRAIRWNAGFYLWPNIALPEEANYLRLPTGSEVKTLDSRRTIASVIAFEKCYTTLPMLYNSVVERALLDDLRRRIGSLFRTRYPDVCSGFLVAAALDQYLSVGLPMSVAGLSHKSVGIGHHMIPAQNHIGEEFLRLNAREGKRMRQAVPDLHVFPVVPVADCFEAVKEALFPEDDTLCLDRRTVISHCVYCLRTNNLEEWRQCLAVMRATLRDDADLERWFDETFGDFPPNLTGHLPLRHPWVGHDGACLHLNTTAFGVRDVCGAAELCDKLIGCRGADLVSRFTVQGVEAPPVDLRDLPGEARPEVEPLQAESTEPPRLIQEEVERLQAESTERLRIIHELERQLRPGQLLTRYPRRLVGKVLRLLRLRKSA